MPTLAHPSLLEKFPEGSVVPEESLDQTTLRVSREVLPEVARQLLFNSLFFPV